MLLLEIGLLVDTKEGYFEPGHIPLIALFSLLYYVNPSVLVMAEADPLLGTSPSG